MFTKVSIDPKTNTIELTYDGEPAVHLGKGYLHLNGLSDSDLHALRDSITAHIEKGV